MVLLTLVNSPMPVTQTPQRFSGVGAITDGPLLPSGPVTPARPPLKLSAPPFNVEARCAEAVAARANVLHPPLQIGGLHICE